MGPFAGWRPLTLMSEEMVPGSSYPKRGGGPVHIQLPLRGAGAQRLKGVLCHGLLLNRLWAAEMAAPTTRYGARCCSGHPRLTGSPERGAAERRPRKLHCAKPPEASGGAAPLRCSSFSPQSLAALRGPLWAEGSPPASATDPSGPSGHLPFQGRHRTE